MDTTQTRCVEALLQNTSNGNNFNQWPITPLAETSRPQWCDAVCLRIVCKSDMPDLVTNVGRSTWRGPRASPPLELRWPFIYILLTVHLVRILGKGPTWRTILSYVFISILYMFRATSCSSSGESIVSIQHLVYVTLCRWPFRVHTKRSPTQSNMYQMLYWYNWFSWWWARSCSKHVENWNKHIEKKCASSWSFTKNPTVTCWLLLSSRLHAVIRMLPNMSTKITVMYTYLHRNTLFHNDCLRFFVSF